MTLDEARECLGVGRTASVEEIREAFRRAARAVHPDRHPGADAARRAELGRDFDRAREARDILVRHAGDPLRAADAPPPAAAPHHADRDAARPRARPRTSHRHDSAPPRAARVTMRFDEFIAWTDAAGFRAGVRSRPYTDWPRLVAWSIVALAVAVAVGSNLVASASI